MNYDMQEVYDKIEQNIEATKLLAAAVQNGVYALMVMHLIGLATLAMMILTGR